MVNEVARAYWCTPQRSSNALKANRWATVRQHPSCRVEGLRFGRFLQLAARAGTSSTGLVAE
jgi:hypothetical protein